MAQQQETHDESQQLGQSIPAEREIPKQRQRHRIQIMHVNA